MDGQKSPDDGDRLGRANSNEVTLVGALAHAKAAGIDSRTIVLVEGVSDENAVTTLARRRGRDLESEAVSVIPIGGATNLGHFLELVGRQEFAVPVAGLFDATEEADVRSRLELAGYGSGLTRREMEKIGFFVCVADLEDELVRALGTGSVEEVFDRQGELGSFRTFQKQPAQRTRSHHAQLRRFIGTRSGRKVRYGRLLVEELDLDSVPRPLDLLLAHI